MALLIAYAGYGASVFAQDWKRESHSADNAPQLIPSVTPKKKRAPRATLIATPTPVARATLVATPASVPRAELVATPAPVPRAELIATPAPRLAPMLPTPIPSPTPLLTPEESWANSGSKQLPTPAWHLPEPVAQLPNPVPIAPAVTSQTQATAMPSWAGTLLLIPLVAGCAIASTILNRGARRAATQNTEPPRKPQAAVYHDYNQYQQARQRWLHGSSLFAQHETARLAALETKLKRAGPLTGLGCLGFILLALLFGAAGGAGAGWGTLIVGLFVVGLLGACEEQYRRWRWRDQFKTRVFADAVPEPIHEGPVPAPRTASSSAPRAAAAARIRPLARNN